MDALLNKILHHPSNKKVLKFLNIEGGEDILNFRQWYVGRDGFDEGGSTFFENYGKDVPADCKYCFGTDNLMVNPVSGEIFAFHTGRFSIFFRCDFERAQLVNSDAYRKGYTFDCISDITELGENWSFMKADFEDDIETQFRWAFEKTNAKSE